METIEVSRGKLLGIYSALGRFDGQETIINEPGEKEGEVRKRVVVLPYNLSAQTRLAIGYMRYDLQKDVETIEKARNARIKQLSGGTGKVERLVKVTGDDGKVTETVNPDFLKLTDELEALDSELVSFTIKEKISTESLNLGDNKLSPSVIEALVPILK